MAILDKNAYFGKMLYASERMNQNANISSLTEEQHQALSDLCYYRHEMHINRDHIWYGDTETLNPFSDMSDDCICDTLVNVGLPALRKVSLEDLPYYDDYDYILDDEERMEWEEKAEKWNKNKQANQAFHSGHSLWEEESGELEKMYDFLYIYNSEIESYLLAVDKKYDTDYCPNGKGRLV